jgi:predicted extracellular nuclease
VYRTPARRRLLFARPSLIALTVASLLVIQHFAHVFPSITPTALADTGTGSVSLTAAGTAVTENFDTLSNTAGSTTNTALPTGWYITETGGGARDNEQYAVDTGGSTTGDIYSYGAAAATDRALGALRSGTLIPLFGAKFTNNTGATITSLNVAYTGEEWRLGTAARTDQISFEISTSATDLSTGTYTNVAALNFVTPDTATTGAKNGNAAADRTALSTTISSLSIPNGTSFFIRWTDVDATGADDGLAVDDFSITPNGSGGVGGQPTLNINDVTQAEGDSGTSTFAFTVSLNAPAPAGGVSFTVNTADGTTNPATAGSDYVAVVNGSGSIAQGGTSTTVNVTVNGDTTVEPNETFFVNISNVTGATAGDTQGLGTITNDDASLVGVCQIQGSGTTSPFAGQSVTTRGVVTGIKTGSGFYIQDDNCDADPNTSNGVFVFTGSGIPAAAVVGNSVQVAGTVQEFVPSTDTSQKPVTEIGGTPTVSVLSSGNALPTPVTITAADTLVNNLENLERYEGMRVTVPSLTVVAPTQGTITEPSATVASNGVFYGVVTGVARPFREPGINASDPLPAGAPATVPRFDENPERLRIDSDAQPGTTALNVTAGAVIPNVTGPLDYSFRAYTILSDTTLSATNGGATPVPTPTSSEFTVASFNMERFFDTVDDPSTSDPILTQAAFDKRLNKASLIVRTVQRYPDVIGVEEMENLSTLQAVAAKINSDAQGVDGLPNPNYVAYLTEGNDVGGIDVGFLVKESRVSTVSVTQFGKDTTYVNPNNNTAELLNDRPPLVLRATVNRPGGGTVAFTVIVNHLRSLSAIDDPVDGNRVRTKRRAQAEYLANLIQSRQQADPAERIITVGDMNAFRVNDGYVDVIGTVLGTPAPASQVVLASPDLVNPDQTDLVDTLPAAQQYSYSFDGSAQTLDHVIVNPNAKSILTRFAYARDDADQPVSDYADGNIPDRISDHDQPVAYFSTVPVTQPGQLIISEFRLRGSNGANDEFVELYNNTNSDILVNATDGSAGYSLAASDGIARFTVPNGTTIPARGHYLGVNSVGYSLAGYPAGNGTTATGDATYTADIPDNVGIALFSTANPANFTLANRLDAVGSDNEGNSLYKEGTGYPALLPFSTDYSLFRSMATTGLPKDTGDNLSDIVYADTAFTVAGPATHLGAPGPENLTSPVNRGAQIKGAIIDPGCPGDASAPTQACPRYRDQTPDPVNNSPHGTLSIRRRFINNTGVPVTRLRFRIVDFTTAPQASGNGTADLRARTSSDQIAACQGVGGGCASVGATVTISGTTLEVPPPQPNGGGYNSTLSVGTVTLANPIIAGDSINVQFLLGVEQTGSFRFFVIIEALPNQPSAPNTSQIEQFNPKGAAQPSAAPSNDKGAGSRKRLPTLDRN